MSKIRIALPIYMKLLMFESMNASIYQKPNEHRPTTPKFLN